MISLSKYIQPDGSIKLPEKKRKPRKAVNKVSKKRRKTRVGKLGILRLGPADMKAARRRVFERDGYHCVRCGTPVTWESGELMHKRTKRNHGDADENMETGCKRCHRKEHGLRWSAK